MQVLFFLGTFCHQINSRQRNIFSQEKSFLIQYILGYSPLPLFT